MKLKTLALCSLYVAVAIGATVYFAKSAEAQAPEMAEISGPAVILSGASSQADYPPPPDGVPPELHRKVVYLYKRIHNAYPDASRQRIFLKIAEHLDIHPRRLWNAYHSNDRVRPDVRPTDMTRDQRTDRVRDRQTDRVRDRVSPVDRTRIDRPLRDRPVRDRPLQDRPGRK